MGRPISLTFESIFNKLVKENRGGYCYELNALLYYALLALGFKACLCHARLLKDTSSVHMIIIVELDGLWLVDVGWGPGFTEPYLLDNIYRFKDLYEFTLDPCPLAFFEERNNYHQTSSDSCFAKKILCSLATCDGYLSLDGHLLTEHFAGKKTTTIISSDNEFRQILQNRFGLNLAINRPVWIEDEKTVLHSPRNKSDWDGYHQIRIKQIHECYCPELTYDVHDPEEKDVNNFPLVFRKIGSDDIIGTIRIDLLPTNEASFRWIAIDTSYIRQGFGSKMLKLSESFVKTRNRAVIRIPATAQSLSFAQSLGFDEEPWELQPDEACMISVCKRLFN